MVVAFAVVPECTVAETLEKNNSENEFEAKVTWSAITFAYPPFSTISVAEALT